jgi:hypothetical protein
VRGWAASRGSQDRQLDHAVGVNLTEFTYAKGAPRGADILSASEGDIPVPRQEPSHQLSGIPSESLAYHPFVIAS